MVCNYFTKCNCIIHKNILLMAFSDLCGTPGYLAPEVLKCNMFENAEGYGYEVDM